MGRLARTESEGQRITRKIILYGNWLEAITIRSGGKHIGDILPSHKGALKLMSDYDASEDQEVKQIERSFETLNRLIISNFFWLDWETQVTLNYSEPVFDERQVDKDIREYWRKVRETPWLGQVFEYLAVKIPDSTGSWHCRMLFKGFPFDYTFLDSETLERLWENGPVDILNLGGKAEVALEFYGMRYDRELLNRYPESCRLFHCSKGITLPPKRQISRGDVESIVSERRFDLYSCSEYSIVIKGKDGNTIETSDVFYEEYLPQR